MTSEQRHIITVEDEGAGMRVDAFIAARVEGLTRSQVKRLLDEECVRVDGKQVKASYAVEAGEVIDVCVPPPREPSAIAQEIPLDVLHEDADIIVVNKPAGMVVHPAAGHPDGTLMNALLAHCDDLSGIGGELKAGIVHRLDVGTTGVIVAAKNDAAHQKLSDQFQARTVLKIYGALVFGAMPERSGRIESELGRCEGDRKKISSHTRKGRIAITEWRVLDQLPGPTSWLEIRLHTGRTHQIRVHLAEENHPLVGDPLYGGARKLKRITDATVEKLVAPIDRPLLHAWRLGLDHPRTGERMEFVAPLPEDIEDALFRLGVGS